ncbi:Os07g0235650 [Oryza sativa Japonica Group]|nr:Os07g0235650 [Oryza sativa Japonica Group]
MPPVIPPQRPPGRPHLHARQVRLHASHDLAPLSAAPPCAMAACRRRPNLLAPSSTASRGASSAYPRYASATSSPTARRLPALAEDQIRRHIPQSPPSLLRPRRFLPYLHLRRL